MLGLIRKLFISFYLVFSVLFASGQEKTNIILFLSDDHGFEDSGCYGNPDLKTPVMDQLAREGMLFRNAYTPASVCAPSRAALYTGLYPSRNGCMQNHGRISQGIKTLADYLIPLGYELILAGKTHIEPRDAFDFTFIERYQIADFLQNIGSRPFCLIIAYNSPHQPYFNHKAGYSGVRSKSWLPETRQTSQLISAYYDHVNILDNEIGTDLYWIEKYGFSDALQIYTSDHGAAFPFAKWTLYNHGIKVPFIVKWHGKVQTGSESEVLVSFVDILPTLIEIAGGSIPENLDGKSILGAINGNQQQLREFIYASYTNKGVKGANEYPIRAIIGTQYKLIVNLKFNHEFQINLMNYPDERALVDSYDVLQSWQQSDDSFKKSRAATYFNRPPLELYDLKRDPYELENLAEDANLIGVKKNLMEALKQWMEQQNDPMAMGMQEFSNYVEK